MRARDCKPRQEPILEEIGGIGVVVGGRRIEEQVTPSRVAEDLGLGSMRHQRINVRSGDPVIGIRHVQRKFDLMAPIPAELARGSATSNEDAPVDVARLLSQQLSGKGAQREPDRDVSPWVSASRAPRDIGNGVVTDGASVPHPFIESIKDPSCIEVGHMDGVAHGFKARGQEPQAFRQAVRVMEEQDLCHHSSVRPGAR